jgi:hypothetical protein
MGKSKRKLTAALKANNEDLDKRYGDPVNSSLNEPVHSLSIDKIEENIKKCTDHIYNDLLEYVNDEAFPLCEFLDKPNIENYIRWVLKTN